MKLIFVSSDGDYGSNTFETKFNGTPVSDIIKNPKKFTIKKEDIEVEVIEVGEVSELFIEFIRSNIQDYDESKNKNFWMDWETIGE